MNSAGNRPNIPRSSYVVTCYSVFRDWLIDLCREKENGPIAQFWLERTPDKREVTGSSPVRPTSRFLDFRDKILELRNLES